MKNLKIILTVFAFLCLALNSCQKDSDFTSAAEQSTVISDENWNAMEEQFFDIGNSS